MGKADGSRSALPICRGHSHSGLPPFMLMSPCPPDGKEPIHASMFGSFSARRDFPRKMLKIYEVIE